MQYLITREVVKRIFLSSYLTTPGEKIKITPAMGLSSMFNFGYGNSVTPSEAAQDIQAAKEAIVKMLQQLNQFEEQYQEHFTENEKKYTTNKAKFTARRGSFCTIRACGSTILMKITAARILSENS